MYCGAGARYDMIVNWDYSPHKYWNHELQKKNALLVLAHKAYVIIIIQCIFNH